MVGRIGIRSPDIALTFEENVCKLKSQRRGKTGTKSFTGNLYMH